jgi:hypothetical protein
MTWRWSAVLVAIAAGGCVIPVDTSGAASIPTEIAAARLQELLPTATYVTSVDPRMTIERHSIAGWTADAEGLEIRVEGKAPIRVAWSVSRGAELTKHPFRFEVRLFVGNRQPFLYFNWKREADARRAVELFEAVRGDR